MMNVFHIIKKYIQAIKTAVEHDGVDLMGYLAWSPIDF